MPIGFSDTSPKTCLCGMPLSYGLLIVAVLSLIEGIYYLCVGGTWFGVLDLVVATTGIAAGLLKTNVLVRQVNFGVWMAGMAYGAVLMCMILFGGSDYLRTLCEQAGTPVDTCLTIGHSDWVWTCVLGFVVGIPMFYLVGLTAWFAIEEAKVTKDDDYK